ncbi:hypothetical protein [Nocardia asteroides]|uniref:hypothetical protein n=1 Tax=Nocardia asteroides TaxID=1824 RepID=UPI0033CF22DD
MSEITSPNGTRITIRPEDDDQIVRMDGVEVGRVIDGTFQSVPFSPTGLSPVTLRALADLIEQHEDERARIRVIDAAVANAAMPKDTQR